MEEWKDIPGYEGLYQASSLGRIKRLEHWKNQKTLRQDKYYHYKMLPERIMAQNAHGGYCHIGLTKDGVTKTFLVHRLIAIAFIENDGDLPEINHIDCNGCNNRVENLEWCDRKHNVNHADRTEKAALSNSKKVKCLDTGIVYASGTIAAEMTGLQKSKISLVCNGSRKTTGGLRWEFA